MGKEKKVPIDRFIKTVNKKYGISLTEKNLPNIKLDASERLILSQGKDSKYSPTMLETNDLDELKSWIGTPDKTFDERPCCRSRTISDWLPAGIIGKSKKDTSRALKRTVDKMKPSEHQKIMHLTKAYLYGDSRPILKYKPLMEAYWDRFRIPQWWFKRIYVPAGSVITISPNNAGILLAYSIEIEEGGKVICNGSMTLDVTRINKL
ncbi:MAG: hypothetical protein ABFS18_11715 [Thermodesulfobacteriota bacterium]